MTIRMRKATSRESPDIPVKAGTDVIQLMNQRIQLFVKWQIKKSGQIDRQNVPLLNPASHQSLNRHELATPKRRERPPFKSEWGQFREHSVRSPPTCLAVRESHVLHLHMFQLTNAGRHIHTDRCQSGRDIKS